MSLERGEIYVAEMIGRSVGIHMGRSGSVCNEVIGDVESVKGLYIGLLHSEAKR